RGSSAVPSPAAPVVAPAAVPPAPGSLGAALAHPLALVRWLWRGGPAGAPDPPPAGAADDPDRARLDLHGLARRVPAEDARLDLGRVVALQVAARRPRTPAPAEL